MTHEIDARIPWRKAPLVKPMQITRRHMVNKKQVGVVNGWTDGEVTYLTDLFIDEGERYKGYGTQLLQRFLSAVAGTTVVVLTSGAHGLYEKFGFVPRECMIRRPDAQGPR